MSKNMYKDIDITLWEQELIFTMTHGDSTDTFYTRFSRLVLKNFMGDISDCLYGRIMTVYTTMKIHNEQGSSREQLCATIDHLDSIVEIIFIWNQDRVQAERDLKQSIPQWYVDKSNTPLYEAGKGQGS